MNEQTESIISLKAPNNLHLIERNNVKKLRFPKSCWVPLVNLSCSFNLKSEEDSLCFSKVVDLLGLVALSNQTELVCSHITDLNT